MRWIQRISLGVSLLCGLLGIGIFFSLFRFVANPSLLQEPLVSYIEENLGIQIGFQDAQFVFFPRPGLRVRRLHLESATEGFPDFKARQAWFHFQFLPLVRGKVYVAGIQIREGEGTFGGIPFQHILFKMKRGSSTETSFFEWRAGFFEGKENLQGRGEVFFKNQEGNFWTNLGFKVDMMVTTSLPVTRGLPKDLSKRFFREWAGQLGGQIHLEKQRGTYLIEGRAKLRAKDFQWGSSLPFSVSGETDFLWNLETGALEFQRVPLEAPFGSVEVRGLYKWETGELEEIRVIGRKMILDELARHFPNVSKVLPLEIGFSGESEFDITIGGTWDFLSLHATWNLSSALLTQGKIFSKPKNFPMQINFDFVLKEGSVLSGDFSLRIQGASIKGNLVNLDLTTGAAEFTLLTNKFELKGWEDLLVPFKGYQISGLAKILLSSKGNLADLPTAKHMLNLTLENATFVSSAGKGIREVQVMLDLAPLSLKLRDGTFRISDSLIVIDAELYNLEGRPQGVVNIVSPNFNPLEVLENLQEFLSTLIPKDQWVPWHQIKEKVHRFLPLDVPLEEVGISLKIKEDDLLLQNLEFQTLNGIFRFRGAVEKFSRKPSFWVDSDIQRLSLARYFEKKSQTEKILEGNLFFKGRFQGSGERIKDLPGQILGEGILAITNGEWHSLDFVASLNQLDPFRKLDLSESPSLSFYDLRTAWRYEGGKFETKDLFIHSQDLWVEGEGNLGMDGTVNARLNLNFSKLLTERALDLWGFRGASQGKQLGPIPFILVGSLRNPRPRIDDQRILSLLEAIQSHALHRLLREPFKGSS